jgi:arylsulfatase A-like enzyme
MPTDRPNILLIVIDCLRADRAFDPERTAQTPTLNALAERGALFTHLITANSMTIPCMTTMFTGVYPAHHGVRAMVGARVADDRPLLAEILRANGYHTYAQATGPLSPFYRLDRGFDQYQLRDGVKSSLLGAWGDDLIRQFGAGEFAQPWFAYLHLWGVHRPRQISPGFDKPEYGRTEYDRAISSYDARLAQLLSAIDEDNTLILITGDHGEKIPETGLENRVEMFKKSVSRGAAGKPSAWSNRRRKAVARAREAWFSTSRLLYRAGLVDSPLATMTGHGYHVYDSLVRVPLVIAGGPARRANARRVGDQARQVDILPTILDLVGLADKTPAQVDGRSLVPLLRGERVPEVPAFIETCQNSREPSSFYGVRYGGWKYAYDAARPGALDELYNLATDPDETKNLATSAPAKVTELRRLIEDHLAGMDTAGVAMGDELSELEMAGLADHLRKLGYVE